MRARREHHAPGAPPSQGRQVEGSGSAAHHGPVTLDEPGLVRWGERIGRQAARPLVLALSGELGAGKSVLARAVARGAGVTAPMPSPTFNLLYRYPVYDGAVIHIDLYRVRDPDEVWELGWRELGAEGEIVLIEWPERAGALVPVPRWDVTLTAPAPGSLLRIVEGRAVGDAAGLPAPDVSKNG